MPMKLGLKFMAIVRANGMDPEGEFTNHIIDKIYSILLGVAGINFQGSDAGSVVYRSILETTDGWTV